MQCANLNQPINISCVPTMCPSLCPGQQSALKGLVPLCYCWITNPLKAPSLKVAATDYDSQQAKDQTVKSQSWLGASTLAFGG